MIAATGVAVLAGAMAVEAMIVARPVTAGAVAMIEVQAAAVAGMEAAIMETVVVAEAIAAVVEAGRKAEEEGLPAPGLVRK